MVARLPSWRGLTVLLGGEGTQRGLSFVAIWLLTQRMTREQYAPVEVALAALMFAALVVELGLPLLGAREVARQPTHALSLVRPVVGLQLVTALVLAGLAFVARAAGWIDGVLAQLLPVYALSLLLLPWLVPWLFQGLGAMAWVAAPGVLRQGLFLAGVAVWVTDGERIARLPWIEVAAVGGAAALAQLAWRKRTAALRAVGAIGAIGEPRALPSRSALLREAAPMGLSQFLWALRMFLATLLLWNLVERPAVADYGVAHRVMMILQAVITMYFTNLYPTLSRAAVGPRPELARLLVRSLSIATGGALLLAGGIAVAAPWLLHTLFRAEFANAQSIRCLRLLIFVIPLLALRGHFRMTLLSMGRGRLELMVSIGGTLLLAALIPSLARAQGASGAALSLLIAEAAGTAATAIAFSMAWRERRA